MLDEISTGEEFARLQDALERDNGKDVQD